MDIRILVTAMNKQTGDCWINVDLDDEDYANLSAIGITREDIENKNYTITAVDYDNCIDFDETFDEHDTLEDYIKLQYLFNKLDYRDQLLLDSVLELKDIFNITSVSKLIKILENDTLNSKWYLYNNMTMIDVAENFVDECYAIDNSLKNYMDYERLGKDMMMDGCYYEVNNGILCECN